MTLFYLIFIIFDRIKIKRLFMASPQDNILSNEDILNDLVESLEISSKVQEK